MLYKIINFNIIYIYNIYNKMYLFAKKLQGKIAWEMKKMFR